MSGYQTWLIDYIQNHPDFIQPEYRKNEVLGFLKEPLEDLCITRPKARLTWGIEYPGSKDHVVYVWFDALLNYVTGAGYLQDDKKFRSLWPADFQLLGKDILRQHAVFWPIMLKAMGVEMPKLVFAHGWWRIGGAKMSKSIGNVVDPIAIVQKYGSDVLRYFLLNEVTLGLDGTYSEDLLVERYSSDLANGLGNLWHRTASMIEKYFGGAVPNGASGGCFYDPARLWEGVSQAVFTHDPREALAKIWAVITRANQFVEETKPWALAKDLSKKEELADVLYHLADSVAHVAVLLQAFMPETAKKILGRLKVLGYQNVKTSQDFMKPLVAAGTAIEKGEPLFPRLDDPLESKTK
jgi:methionyl-tRNA synthetase